MRELKIWSFNLNKIHLFRLFFSTPTRIFENFRAFRNVRILQRWSENIEKMRFSEFSLTLNLRSAVPYCTTCFQVSFRATRVSCRGSRVSFSGKRVSFCENHVSFSGKHLSFSGNGFPSAKTMFPLAEIIFPLAEIAFPLWETIFPLAETAFPLGKTVFPLAESMLGARTNFRFRNMFARGPDHVWARCVYFATILIHTICVPCPKFVSQNFDFQNFADA